MTITERRVFAALSLVTLVSACVSAPHLAQSSEVIAMQKSGVGDPALLEWVKDHSRSFDLSDSDIADLAEAGVSEQVIEAMLERSEEHHEGGGRSHGHDH